MKILICGDSFASDWTVKHKGVGWPSLLAQAHTVTNVAQAGTSIYKTYIQLLNSQVNEHDCVIVSHTSPHRIPVKKHPVHYNDILHKNSDLIYADIKHHAKENKNLDSIVKYFENYYDDEYAVFVYNLIEEKIDNLLKDYNGIVIHMTHVERRGLYVFKDMLDLSDFDTKKYRGLINHRSDEGNKLIFDRLQKVIY